MTHDKYVRDPAFWEPIDGDINAVAVVQPSGRAVNSDVLTMDSEVLVVESRLMEYGDPYPHQEDIKFPDEKRLRLWMESHPDEFTNEDAEFFNSLTNLRSIPREEDCYSYLGGDLSKKDKARGYPRTRRAFGALLWGGEYLIEASLPSDAGYLAYGSCRYHGLPAFSNYRVAELLGGEWRLDSSISHREMVLMVEATKDRFDHSHLLLSELIYATAHNRQMVVGIEKPKDQYREKWLKLRSDTIDQFREVVSDDSALAWFSYFGQSVMMCGKTVLTYNISSATTGEYRRRLRDMLKIAGRVSFAEAKPLMDTGIWDADVVVSIAENSIDMDMVAAVGIAA